MEASLRFPRGTTIIRSPKLLLSEALGAPGSPQRTWDDNDLFPLLQQDAALACGSPYGPPPALPTHGDT